jgi:glycosyltransferase involved in cell wall biosynthesis
VIAYLGRLVEEKGIRVLLEAYASLGICETTSLLCLGAGPLAKACRSTPGVVVVEGLAHSDVPDYIRLADLVVLPSLTRSNWKEQLGRAAIEAMACGLPVIVSNSGELPNLVEAGRTGLIVPEGDSSALASAIGRLLDDERIRAELGAAARLYAESVYSLPVVADRLARALQIET